ncbi:MAG: hypothetical protein RLZZ618_3019 [Pseudomonadota bacterium]|jgi:iron complex outermembrane receptor protein
MNHLRAQGAAGERRGMVVARCPTGSASVKALTASIGAAVMLAQPAGAQALAYSDLRSMSFEELANIEITSVSKKTQLVADAAASVFVITADDLERSGATSLPEALRLAPNLQVARVDARKYSISARGFNGLYSNKLLVLIDGRSVYSPLFSGVFWDTEDVILEDIERIEVISGAGSTLWGANAVNGVINVVTRSAAKTQGTLVSLGGAEQEQTVAVRHGDVLAGTQFRVYGKHVHVNNSHRADSSAQVDGTHRTHAGLRADGGDEHNGFRALADAYSARVQQPGFSDYRITGFNTSGQWRTRLREGSSLSLQATFDQLHREQPGALDERLNVGHLEFQHTVTLADSHHVVWGSGYRHATDRVSSVPAFAFLPTTRTMHWGSVFVQDEIGLRDDLRLTLGLKFEHNGYTGWEPLPNVRLAFKPADKHLVWASAARTARIPSRFDRDFHVPGAPPVVGGVPQYSMAGGPDMQNEKASVFEFGYRGHLLPTLSCSVTAFSADYDGLRSVDVNPNGPGLVLSNGGESTVRGVEAWAAWQATPAWRVQAGVVSQSLRTTYRPGSASPVQYRLAEDADPHHYWTLRSSFELTERTFLDMSLRHVGELRTSGVPAYDALDAHLGWRVRAGLTLSILGKNLLDPRHAEFGGTSTNAGARSELDRSVHLKMTWRL